MTSEEKALSKLRRERIARVRKILRWMPRRSNVHRYPGLRWFAKSARSRMDLWSFRISSAVPAIWWGVMLSMWPLYGIQIPLAILVAILFRANLPILVSLQMITNPITVIPIYYTAYNVGKLALSLFGLDYESLAFYEIGQLLRSFTEGLWLENFQYFGKVWLITFLGSTVLGTFFAATGSLVYKFSAKEIAISYAKLREIQANRKKENKDSKGE